VVGGEPSGGGSKSVAAHWPARIPTSSLALSGRGSKSFRNNPPESNTAFNARDEILDVFWAGARYTVVKDVDLIGAYYHYTQPGTEDVFSGAVRGQVHDGEWEFLPKWDTYNTPG
jgi:hypothetical protein